MLSIWEEFRNGHGPRVTTRRDNASDEPPAFGAVPMDRRSGLQALGDGLLRRPARRTDRRSALPDDDQPAPLRRRRPDIEDPYEAIRRRLLPQSPTAPRLRKEESAGARP